MKKICLLIIMASALSCESNKNSTETKVEKIELGNKENPFIGYVRTTNLSREDADLLGLKTGDYQLVSNMDNYFLDGKIDFKNLLGKCVELTAKKTRNAGEKGDIHDYNRANLKVTAANVIDSKNCTCQIKPGLSEMMSDIKSVHGNEKANTILTGTITHSTRPAPDVPYDHYLKLDKPYTDQHDPSGKPTTVDKIWILPIAYQQIWKMEELINSKQKVRISGYKMGGFVESTIFYTFKIEELD